jgi:hypothetical protein
VNRRAQQELMRGINDTGNNRILDQVVGCMRWLVRPHPAQLELMCIVRTERLNLVAVCLQQFPDANPVTSGHLEPRRQ